MTIALEGTHFPKDAILQAVSFYSRYGVSHRGLEEIMAKKRCCDEVLRPRSRGEQIAAQDLHPQ